MDRCICAHTSKRPFLIILNLLYFRENLDACDVGHMYLCRLKNRSLERPKMHGNVEMIIYVHILQNRPFMVILVLFCLAEDLDGGEYLFAFRMLMVLFRREFSFVDALYLWEVRSKNQYNVWILPIHGLSFINDKPLLLKIFLRICLGSILVFSVDWLIFRPNKIWFQLMWAMEYNPNIFSSYEESSPSADKSSTLNTNGKMLKKCGKFERKNVKTGYKNQHSSLAVFLVASVLATKNKRFLKEAKGLDDVVKVSFSLCVMAFFFSFCFSVYIDLKNGTYPDLGWHYWKFRCKKSMQRGFETSQKVPEQGNKLHLFISPKLLSGHENNI